MKQEVIGSGPESADYKGYPLLHDVGAMIAAKTGEIFVHDVPEAAKRGPVTIELDQPVDLSVMDVPEDHGGLGAPDFYEMPSAK